MWTPCEISSLSFLTFLAFLCSTVSFRAAFASSWALWERQGGASSVAIIETFVSSNKKASSLMFWKVSDLHVEHLCSCMNLTLSLNVSRRQWESFPAFVFCLSWTFSCFSHGAAITVMATWQFWIGVSQGHKQHTKGNTRQASTS